MEWEERGGFDCGFFGWSRGDENFSGDGEREGELAGLASKMDRAIAYFKDLEDGGWCEVELVTDLEGIGGFVFDVEDLERGGWRGRGKGSAAEWG